MKLLIKAIVRVVGSFALCVAIAYFVVLVIVGGEIATGAEIVIAAMGAVLCPFIVVGYYLDMVKADDTPQRK